MYTALLLLLLLSGGWFAFTGARTGRRGRMVLGVLWLVATGLFFGLLDFWGEWLWFEAVGYERRFWADDG